MHIKIKYQHPVVTDFSAAYSSFTSVRLELGIAIESGHA
jgi:hypothetical protein